MKSLILAIVLTLGLTLPAAGQAVSPPQMDVVAWSAGQLDGHYRTLFALEGRIAEYRTPRLTVAEADQIVSTGCGRHRGDMMAFYCPVDQHIVVSAVLMEQLANEDDFLPAYVIAHEWAHHIQNLSGTVPRTYGTAPDGDWDVVYTIENELRADCMAGAWMGNVAARGFLNATDMPAVLLKASQIGGDSLYGRNGSHGTGAERLRAVFLGYERGMIGCMSITPLPRGGM